MGERLCNKFLVILLAYGPCLLAQIPVVSFNHLTIDDGLSQNSVNVVFQDSKGFMWFGTQDGLNRYDGYDFLQYRVERTNPNSISNNYIWDLYEDSQHRLWIATFGGGLNCLHLDSGKIQYFKKNTENSEGFPSDRLFSILETSDGILWIGSNEGLIRFNKETHKSEIFLSENSTDDHLKDNYIGIVEADDNGNLWLRSSEGLTFFNTQTLQAEHYQSSPFTKQVKIEDISDIQNINGLIYVLTTDAVIEIDPNFKTDRLLFSSTDITINDRIPSLRKLLVLNNRELIIGTNIGIIRYNADSGKSDIYQSDPEDNKGLTHGYITSLFQSEDNVIWVGTRNGLNILETLHPDFIHIRNIPGKPGLSSKNVNSFIQENDSLFWIGTTDGLNLYNKNTNQFKVFRKSKGKNNLHSNYILCLYKDSRGNKWVGTRSDGLYHIDPNLQFKKKVPYNENATGRSIHFIEESKSGDLWLGTGGAGLWMYNPIKNTIKKYPANKDGSGPAHSYVFTILEDSYGNVWLGTATGGLNLFDPLSERFLYFQHSSNNHHSLSNDLVLSLHEDNEHQLWVGTNGGLNKFIPKLQKDMFKLLQSSSSEKDSLFLNFSKEAGFPNDVIYGILEDDHNALWTSTNKGIVEFDKQAGRVNKAYDISHGLQSNEFNQNGYYKDNSGNFLFGGVDGLNIFNPDSIGGNNYPPKVVITNLLLSNKPVPVRTTSRTDNFTLPKTLASLDDIYLSWKHDMITLNYVGLSYISPEMNKYRYKLEGLKDEWIEAGDLRSVTFTNLSPGDYTFHVQAANNNDIWNTKGASLGIHISTPPWSSWYAYLLYALMLGTLFYLFLKYRIYRATEKLRLLTEIEKARIEERESFRKRSSKDFHDEAGTKITRIALITELVKQQTKGDPQIQEQIRQLSDNLQDLNTGMRDFIWALDPTQDNVYDTLLRFTDFAGKFCELAGVQFNSNEISPELQHEQLNMAQRRHMLLILKESVHNSIKHGNPLLINFTAQIESGKLLLSLKDDGCGFDHTNTSGGNGLKNMKERAEEINAEFEIRTRAGKGCELRLEIPITQLGE